MHAPADEPIGRIEMVADLIGRVSDVRSAGVVIIGAAGLGKSHVARTITGRLETSGHRLLEQAELGSFEHSFDDDDLRTVVLVDDVDRVDDADLATFVEAAIANRAWLVVTARPDEALPGSVQRAIVAGSITSHPCRPLDRADTATLAQHFPGAPITPEGVRTIYALTQGIPLHVRELMAVALDGQDDRGAGGSDPLTELSMTDHRLVALLRSRTGDLDESDLDALTRIAIVGEASIGELDDFVTDETFARLEQAGLVTTRLDGRRLRLTVTHSLDAAVLRATASPVIARRVRVEHLAHLSETGLRRAEDRLRLAEWSLDGIGAPDADLLAETARMAAAKGDHRTSQRLAESAFAQAPSVELAQLVGFRQYAAGDFGSMQNHFPDWDRLARTAPERAAYESMRAIAGFWRGFDESAIDRLLTHHATWSDASTRIDLQATAASLLVTNNRIDAAVTLAEELGELPPSPNAVKVAVALGHGLRSHGQPIRAVHIVERSLEVYRSISDDAFLLSDAAMAGLHIHVLAEAGRFAELDLIVATRANTWRDFGDAPNSALAGLALGLSWLLRGDYERAVELAAEAEIGFASAHQAGMVRWAKTLAAAAHAESGRIDQAQSLLDDLDSLREHPARIFDATLQRSRAWVAYHTGFSNDALDLLTRATADAFGAGNISSALDCLHDMTRQGHVAAAAALASDDAAARLDEIDGEFHLARLCHIRSSATGDTDGLSQCVETFDRLGCRHLAADCALAAARVAQSPAQSRRWMREARHRRSGRHDVIAESLDDLPFTSREREVVTLALRGLTSRQIAERLGNSRRTVESHLGNVYSKLGVDGRIGLVERLVAKADGR